MLCTRSSLRGRGKLLWALTSSLTTVEPLLSATSLYCCSTLSFGLLPTRGRNASRIPKNVCVLLNSVLEFMFDHASRAVLERNIGLNLWLPPSLHWQTGRFKVWVNARQNSGLKISFRNRVFRLHKLVPSTEKRPRKPGTGIKNWLHEFPFVTFRPEKRDYFLGCSVAPGIFPQKPTTQKVEFYLLIGFSGNFCKW